MPHPTQSMTSNEIERPQSFSGLFWKQQRFDYFASVGSILLLAALLLTNFLSPQALSVFLAKDENHPLLFGVENLTVLVLLPAIIAGIAAFVFSKHRLPLLFRLWPLAWAAACFYFAGEEASWGQWYFHWDTPETMQVVNQQQETNLHNISSWLNQKPRALVESFILICGGLLPLWIHRKPLVPSPKSYDHFWRDLFIWITPPRCLLAAVALFTLTRVMDWLHPDTFRLIADSELRELTIAWFLMLYLISLALRVRQVPRQP